MKKKNLLVFSGNAALIAFLLLAMLLACTREQPTTRPNIILIVTDDQDTDSLRFMPKLSTLVAARGIRFTNAFVASPVCIPSRASIFLGTYLHRHNIFLNTQDIRNNGLENQTVATMLQTAGYTTCLVGKYLNSGYWSEKPLPGWDHWYSIMTDNVYYDYKLNENGKVVTYGSHPQDNISSVLTEKARHFIKSTGRKPFFLYIGTVAPHVPADYEARYADAFADIEPQFTFEKDLADKPRWVRETYSANPEPRKKYFSFSPTDTTLAADWYKKRWRSLQSVDTMIEEITKDLGVKGKLDNTFIFYLSDNGDGLTKHVQVSAKLVPYEEGIRVPFLVMGPGLTGTTQDNLVSTVDILPTFAGIAGCSVPGITDGRSLMPLLAADQPLGPGSWRDHVVVELGHVENWFWKSTPPMYRLLRGVHDKYIEYITGEREYYDIDKDPDEMNNLYDNLEEGKKKDLAARMQLAAPWQEWEKREKGE